ncbi:MAG TPA: sugar phosphate isomerase/epimerase family protein [Candidatus Hydrogenedentes bacterium]|nr:sugar phosphate isomerase/epimerase family protein [Candidatus Hydrogenedentota bacterium]HPG69332.1 sugar phosphate isomerase/epimerase family protein [Candidatus Hydrogenedentota bacterium]
MIPTLFSVSYAGLWGQARLDTVSFIRKAAELGYRAVELMGKRPHLSVLEASPERLAAVHDAARTAGVEIATIAGYTDFTAGQTAAEVPCVEMQVAYVEGLARMGAALGAKIVRVFTGYTADVTAPQQDWNRCVAAIRECAAVAQGHGVVLGVQNHHDVAVGVDAYREFLHDVGHSNCRAMFDPWAPALHGDDLYECAKAMAPHMVQTTLADYVRLKRFVYRPGLINYEEVPGMVRAVPLSEGFVDLDAFFSGLKDGGFHGYVAYEMCSPLRGGGSIENLDGAAAKSLDVIRRLIAG